jgi:hypothetical protein
MPGPDHPCAGFVEIDGEGLRVRINVEIPVGPPPGGDISMGDLDPFEDPAELSSSGVKDPGAVARLQDDEIHEASLPDQGGAAL